MATLKSMLNMMNKYVERGMDISDAYMGINMRLGTITSSSAEKAALQQSVFAAAARSRGDYEKMADAMVQMQNSGNSLFSDGQEALGFIEILQKSLKISGTGQEGQNSAFQQVIQAMSAGSLGENGLQTIMENAPAAAGAIAQYMGKSKGELQALATEGAITSEVIKNAMFQASANIESRFSSMPMSFSDIWTRIQSTGLQALGGVIEKISALLNSDMGQSVINNLTGAIYMAAAAAGILLDGLGWIIDKLDLIAPIILSVVAAIGAYLLIEKAIKAGTAAVNFLSIGYGILTGNTAAVSAAQFVYNGTLLSCPITWFIGAIILLIGIFYAAIAAINHFAGTSISATGLIGAAFFTLAAYIYNTFVFPIWKMLAMLANFIGNACFNDPVAAVKVLFLDMALTCVDYILTMAKAIENIINKIPGVTVDITSGLDNFKAGLEDKIGSIKDESGWTEYVKEPEIWDYSEMAEKGYNAGSDLADKVSNFISGFNPNMDDIGKEFGLGDDYYKPYAGGSSINDETYGSTGNPATVQGTGQNGAVKVEEEDVEWMRKLAERDYVARIAQNTLAPNIRVEFSGPITKEADTDNVMAHVVQQLKDVIATAPEGVPV